MDDLNVWCEVLDLRQAELSAQWRIQFDAMLDMILRSFGVPIKLNEDANYSSFVYDGNRRSVSFREEAKVN